MAETEFSDYFQMPSAIDNTIADRVTSYHAEDINLKPAQQERELLELQKQLDAMQTDYKNDASFWFIKGLNNKNIASFYNSAGKPDKANQYTLLKNEDYRHALQITENASNKLTPAIYNAMKHGLSEDLKIQATQSELSLGGNADNESAYWYLHWSNIDQLKKAGRDEEALQAFENMQREMLEKNVDMSVYGELNKAIENTTFSDNKISHSEPAQKSSPEKKAKSIEKDSVKVEAAPEQKDNIMPMLLIFAIASLLLVTVYEFVIKKK